MNDNDELLIKAIKDLELGNYKQARDNFQIALSKNNENADSWVFFGFCQIKLKDFENAYNSFNNALKIDNQHSFAWSGKAYLLWADAPGDGAHRGDRLHPRARPH